MKTVTISKNYVFFEQCTRGFLKEPDSTVKYCFLMWMENKSVYCDLGFIATEQSPSHETGGKRENSNNNLTEENCKI